MRGSSNRSISAFWRISDSCEGRNIGFQRNQRRCRRWAWCTAGRTANAVPLIPAHTNARRARVANRTRAVPITKWLSAWGGMLRQFLSPRGSGIVSLAVKPSQAKTTMAPLLMYPALHPAVVTAGYWGRSSTECRSSSGTQRTIPGTTNKKGYRPLFAITWRNNGGFEHQSWLKKVTKISAGTGHRVPVS